MGVCWVLSTVVVLFGLKMVVVVVVYRVERELLQYLLLIFLFFILFRIFTVSLGFLLLLPFLFL